VDPQILPETYEPNSGCVFRASFAGRMADVGVISRTTGAIRS
jgi:hypothetical protein